MKLQSKKPRTFVEMSEIISTIIRISINLLLVVIICALVFGVFKAGYDLFTHLGDPVEKLLPEILVDTVFIVALVEISLLLLGYLRDGHMHVRYIVDTILIIMLNEFVVLWFDSPDMWKMLTLCAITATLVAARVFVTKFAPVDAGKKA